MPDRRHVLLSAAAFVAVPGLVRGQSGPTDTLYRFTLGPRRRSIEVTLRALRRPGRYLARIVEGGRVSTVRLRLDPAAFARVVEAMAATAGVVQVGGTRAELRLTGDARQRLLELRLGDGTTGTGATTQMDPVTGGVVVVGLVIAGIVAIVGIAGAQGTEVSASISTDGSSISADVSVAPGEGDGGEDTGGDTGD